MLATQYAAKLKGAIPGHDDLLSAIIGNVGTMITFRLGKDDAELLAPVFHPCFRAGDIINLPNWRGYISTGINGESLPPFSFSGIRDDTPFRRKVESRIISAALTRYGRDATVIDREMMRRRGYGK